MMVLLLKYHFARNWILFYMYLEAGFICSSNSTGVNDYVSAGNGGIQ
jgi:hypothetical protein